MSRIILTCLCSVSLLSSGCSWNSNITWFHKSYTPYTVSGSAYPGTMMATGSTDCDCGKGTGSMVVQSSPVVIPQMGVPMMTTPSTTPILPVIPKIMPTANYEPMPATPVSQVK